MITNFDNTFFTPEMLKQEWWRSAERLKSLLYAGWTLEEIWSLSNYIYESPFAYFLYPGTSLGKLLISKPVNGKLDYSKTLHVIPDVMNNNINLKYCVYKDGDILNQEILWHYECAENNLNDKFNEFINWNKHWK